MMEPSHDNNNQMKSSPREAAVLSSSSLVYRLALKGFHLVLRFYITCLLIAYHWAQRLVEGALKPFQPVMTEVKKVPKKDISAEGIFYQVLRLQFLCVLYVSPWVVQAVKYVCQPLVWARDWCVGYVKRDDDSF